MEEQREILSIVEEKFNSADKLEGEIEVNLVKVDKSKQSILASAFSGDLH